MNGNSDQTVFKYGGSGERVARITMGGQPEKTSYIRGLSDYPLVEYDDGGTNTRLYVYGQNGLIAVKDNTNWYFVVRDHLGSTRVLISQSNVVMARYHYSPYGRTMWAQVSQNLKYRFTGQEFDEQTGLYNFRARMYDADLGIFYGADPAGQGYAAYAYCGNNPVSRTDPTGLWFGIDDLIVSSVAFVTGYVQHGLSTNNWGKDALASGGIAAGSAWLGYNTGGIAAGYLAKAGTAGYAVAAGTVGGAVGGATGSVGNQLYFNNGKVDLGLVGQSTAAGVAGGIAGSVAGLYMSPVPAATIGGAVSGGVQGSFNGNALQGAMMGALNGYVSSITTMAAYGAYGKYLTNKMLTEGAYNTDYAGVPKGLSEQMKSLGVEFDPATYDCKAFAKDFLGTYSTGEPIVWLDAAGNPVHVGIGIGRDMNGQSIVLSKIGMNHPIRVTSMKYLNNFYGNNIGFSRQTILDWPYAFGIQYK
ncbi:MAG: RHS repeat-associated core domain-containing protein [Ignavibacteriales bacterium]|nr:RHS repeat-associated core domain-containing protein [Ignavibacteriales bacterium]